MDENYRVTPNSALDAAIVHKVKGRWQETARDLVLFPLLKLAALALALCIIGVIVATVN